MNPPNSSAINKTPTIVEGDACVIGRFQAMHCPCEVLLDGKDRTLAAAQFQRAVDEAERIEDRYSRYRRGNIMDEINTSGGRRVTGKETSAR